MNNNVGSATVRVNTKYDVMPTATTLPSSLYPSQDQHGHCIAFHKAKPAYVEPQMPLLTYKCHGISFIFCSLSY